MYIYHLPCLEKLELCRILNQNSKWKELGAKMSFDISTLESLARKGYSPTEELLTIWGLQNHTVLELFLLLSDMQHYQAMMVIKESVEPKYHRLIYEGEHNLNNIIKNLTLDKQNYNEKECNIPQENFDRYPKELNVPQKQILINNNTKPIVPTCKISDGIVSRESNESIVINHVPVVNRKSPSPLPRFSASHNTTISAISSVAESAGSMPQIPYDELKKATNGWDPKTILGKGGFGTVFKGTWKCTQVAIKRLEEKADNPESHTEQLRQSITELHCLNTYRHDNVLPLYGYSIGGAQPCLVYQYMSGGSLEQRLHVRDPKKVLNWAQRLNIAVCSARGLQFLHTMEKPLIHGDIKSANILLDPCDNAKIGDFGLAREGPNSDFTHIEVSRIHGTRPYLPDEFLRYKKASTKVDTYSFGVVLFEIATSLGAYSDQRKWRFLKDHVVNCQEDILTLKDRRVEGGEDCFKGLVDIGKLCVKMKASDRPTMVEVFVELEKIVV